MPDSLAYRGKWAPQPHRPSHLIIRTPGTDLSPMALTYPRS